MTGFFLYVDLRLVLLGGRFGLRLSLLGYLRRFLLGGRFGLRLFLLGGSQVWRDRRQVWHARVFLL